MHTCALLKVKMCRMYKNYIYSVLKTCGTKPNLEITIYFGEDDRSLLFKWPIVLINGKVTFKMYNCTSIFCKGKGPSKFQHFANRPTGYSSEDFELSNWHQ